MKSLIKALKQAWRKTRIMRSVDDIQELYCGNCDKDTNQKVYESGHERDSSGDRFECTECGFVKYGLTGEWEDYA